MADLTGCRTPVRFLALVPRGLERRVRQMAQQDLLHSRNAVSDNKSWSVSFLGEGDSDSEAGISPTTGLSFAAERVKERLVRQKEKKRTYMESSGAQTTTKPGESFIPPHITMGSSDFEKEDYISFGYDHHHESVWTVAGEDKGSVWVILETSTDGSGEDLRRALSKITSLRCLGPLLVLVRGWEDKNSPPVHTKESLQETQRFTKEQLEQSQDGTSYSDQFEQALHVWEHAMKLSRTVAEDGWPNLNTLQYRLSCLRERSKDYSYKRHELLKEVNPILISPTRIDHWNVNLVEFDLECVLVLKPHAKAIGFALAPYSQLKARSFAMGNVPADVKEPYLAQSVLGDMVRLRPSTAHILLRIAQLRPGESLLDPCCGMGTIPVEASFIGGIHAFGGDLVLETTRFRGIAMEYLSKASHFGVHSSGEAKVLPVTLFSWDATTLPLRDCSVDAVVSDLPFGQRCLSSNRLSQLLPLILSECARVLHPSTGRAVFLCGSYSSVVEILDQHNRGRKSSDDIWKSPCECVIPVNIGGHVAWIVHVRRSSGVVSRQSPLVDGYENKVKKSASRRDHVARSQNGLNQHKI